MPESYKRWMAVSDSHGDMIDPEAKAAALAFKKWFKPQIRFHLGDWCDLRALRAGASDDERRESIEDDLKCGLDFVCGDYDATDLLDGNHDWRLVRAAKQTGNGLLSSYAQEKLDKIKHKLGNRNHLPYGKRYGVLRLGNLLAVHGYNSGLTAARLAAQAYGNVLIGHVHAIDLFSMPSLEPREGRSIGCLCNLDLDYNLGHINALRQSHGFAYGFYWPDGRYLAWQARGLQGTWVFPSEFKVWRASA